MRMFYVCSLAVLTYKKLQVTITILFGYIVFDPDCKRKNIHWIGSKWSIISNAHVVLGIWSITIQWSLTSNLIITPLPVTIKLAIRKAVLPWIPFQGPEEVETQCDLTSKAAWGCVNSKDSHRKMLVGIHNNQGTATRSEMNRSGTENPVMQAAQH